jgi:hypothetical protein
MVSPSSSTLVWSYLLSGVRPSNSDAVSGVLRMHVRCCVLAVYSVLPDGVVLYNCMYYFCYRISYYSVTLTSGIIISCSFVMLVFPLSVNYCYSVWWCQVFPFSINTIGCINQRCYEMLHARFRDTNHRTKKDCDSWRKLQNFCTSYNIIKMIKWRKKRMMGYAASMWELRNTYII